MKTNITKLEVDLHNLPPLTDEQHARLSMLDKMPEEKIDYSDIPPMSDDFWKNAIRNPFYKPTKV
jgi:uncharacterized protein (DUF4415 family)